MGFFSRWIKPAPQHTPHTPNATPQSDATLESAMELAGFFAAHAVWSVSDGETLVPLGGFETPDGKRQLNRFAAERLEDGVVQGKEWLQRNADSAARAVLIFDGFIPLAGGKSDALIIVVRDYAPGAPGATWIIPYRPAASPKGFAVHRPKLSLESEKHASETPRFAEAFWRGIARHEKGAEVWNRCLDESR